MKIRTLRMPSGFADKNRAPTRELVACLQALAVSQSTVRAALEELAL